MLIIERFEGDTALIENETERFCVPRSALPETAKEGDVLIREGEHYLVDASTTQERRMHIRALYHKVKQS